MPSALEGMRRPQPIGKVGVVGVRRLPQTRVNYYGKTPKDEAFRTIWPPVNASSCSVKDKTQEIMYMYYNRVLDDEYMKKEKRNLPNSFRLSLQNIPREDKAKSSDKYKLPPEKWPKQWATAQAAMWKCNRNSLPLFATMYKPTCGYYFSYDTDNKRRLIGIPPVNLGKWRTNRRYY